MIQILAVADILHQEVVLEDNFDSGFEGWEIIENEEEQSFIKDGHYWMSNKSSTRWMFYHKKLPIPAKENFMIRAKIQVIQNNNGFGQYGLVWGFDNAHQVLNKFVVNTDCERFTITNFQKDYEFTTHRAVGVYEKDNFSENEQFFSIVKLDRYYYFFLNQYDRPVYMVHSSQLPLEGDRFGFYVEPGIMIRCDKIEVKRLITDNNFKGNPWMPLSEDEMPFGSEILRG